MADRIVHCAFLKKDLPGLDRPPFRNELGQRIYNEISKEAWQQWVKHQVMLINEYRLTPIDPAHRKRLEFEMERFFFGDGSAKPQEFVAPK